MEKFAKDIKDCDECPLYGNSHFYQYLNRNGSSEIEKDLKMYLDDYNQRCE